MNNICENTAYTLPFSGITLVTQIINLDSLNDTDISRAISMNSSDLKDLLLNEVANNFIEV